MSQRLIRSEEKDVDRVKSGRGTQVFVMTLLATEAVVSTMNTARSGSESESPLPTPGDDSLSSRCSDCPVGEPGDGLAQTDMHASLHHRTTGNVLRDDQSIQVRIAEFLPWREAVRMRSVSVSWRGAVTLSGVKITTLPGTATPAAFVRCPKNLLENEEEVESKYRCVHEGGQWRCEDCAYWNSETRMLCGNRQCQRPAASHANNVRVFAGQLRREGTVPLLQWIIQGVIARNDGASPALDIVTIDNHRHPVTQRGKGCAWVYVNNTTLSDAIMQFHHRVFLDTDTESEGNPEGVWIVARESVSELAAFVATRAYLPERSILLPRNCLVLELPGVQPKTNSSAVAGRAAAADNAKPAQLTTVPSALPPSARRQTQAQQLTGTAASVAHPHQARTHVARNIPPPPAYSQAVWYAQQQHQQMMYHYRHDPYSTYQTVYPEYY